MLHQQEKKVDHHTGPTVECVAVGGTCRTVTMTELGNVVCPGV